METDIQTHTEGVLKRHRDWLMDRQKAGMDGQAGRQTDCQTDKSRDRQTQTQTDRRKDRHKLKACQKGIDTHCRTDR